MSEDTHTKELYEALRYSNIQFDKNVLFIASGALGISFAFIEKIIPDLKIAVSSHLLIRSWYFFAGVIFISLLAHFISIMNIRWAITKEDEDSDKNIKKEKYLNYLVRTLNISMIIGLLVGIILLINFIKINL